MTSPEWRRGLPKFYFDFDDGRAYLPDEVGTELADAETARLHAVSVLATLASDAALEGHIREIAVNVHDEERRLVLHARLTVATEWVMQQAA